MADPRFFKREGPFPLRQLAEIADAEIGAGADPERQFSDVATLAAGNSEQVSFLDNRRYIPVLQESRAGCCVISTELAERAPAGMALLVSKRPYRSYAKIAAAFYPKPPFEPSVHPTAIIDPSAKLAPGCLIEPYAVIEAEAEIGQGCRVGAHTVIGRGVVVGEGTEIGPSASLAYCIVGKNCLIHAGARIGTRGFGFTLDPEEYLEVPQLGRVVLGDEVEVGANSTIDRGTIPDTVVGSGSKIDNLVQIGHNVRLGRRCVLVAQSGIAGSSELDDFVILAAQAGVAGHIKMGKGSQLAAKSGLMKNVPAGETWGGTPAMPLKEFFRVVSLWQKQIRRPRKTDE